jgi:hypothetical protein
MLLLLSLLVRIADDDWWIDATTEGVDNGDDLVSVLGTEARISPFLSFGFTFVIFSAAATDIPFSNAATTLPTSAPRNLICSAPITSWIDEIYTSFGSIWQFR